jgi:hypothetical protein
MYADMNQTSTTAEVFYMSGNEKTVVDFNPGGKDGSKGTGYRLIEGDSIGAWWSLGTSHPEGASFYVAITYDIIFEDSSGWNAINSGAGWKGIKPVLLETSNICDVPKESEPLLNNTAFKVKSPTWKANLGGRIVGAVGSIDSGGVLLEIQRGNETLCTSKANYSKTSKSTTAPITIPEFYAPAAEQVSSMSACMDMGNMTKGEPWQIVGKYDYSKHSGDMLNATQRASVMPMAMLLVEVPLNGLPPPENTLIAAHRSPLHR